MREAVSGCVGVYAPHRQSDFIGDLGHVVFGSLLCNVATPMRVVSLPVGCMRSTPHFVGTRTDMPVEKVGVVDFHYLVEFFDAVVARFEYVGNRPVGFTF